MEGKGIRGDDEKEKRNKKGRKMRRWIKQREKEK